MKIRTDFVTNSSSSSFVVEFNMSFGEQKDIEIRHTHFSGDYQGSSLKFGSHFIEDGEDFETGIGEIDSNEINLSKILSSKKTLADELNELFYSVEDEFYEDEEDDESNESDKTSELEDLKDDLKATMESYTASRKNLKNATVRMIFSGRGDGLYGFEESLDKVFGWKTEAKIKEALEEADDATDAVERLRKITELDRFDDDSLMNLYEFKENCEYAPKIILITQNMTSDKKVHMDIIWTDDQDDPRFEGIDLY